MPVKAERSDGEMDNTDFDYFDIEASNELSMCGDDDDDEQEECKGCRRWTCLECPYADI